MTDYDSALSTYFENFVKDRNVESDAVIVSEIPDDAVVLDIGCGFNQFKGRIKNLIGIDKYNNAADYVVDMMDFECKAESFDILLILGSINLGTFELIERQVEKALSWLKPGGKIYMRVNPGDGAPGTYYWKKEEIEYLANKHNLLFVKPITLNDNKRFVFVWQK